ncbi:polyketide synthase [Hypoxylon trugodes]|uniref:polyketide synthase n=1 Tax=Hypoxylon trugodes TaxID=326681 RepID=UPI00218E005D|nr:polyketide synthase [Hypoxylon trugodes]KAI1391900.1 polyketide synthase [Hypoxylon trugodes]
MARENAQNDPSVIVGFACRVPGANNPSQLWQSIVEQRDVQRKMPSSRFNVDNFYHPDGTHKGTTNAKYGYFLEQDVGDFDASFFGISGKEAEAMDPQQRLLLEVVYEALENAGISLDEINGSLTSVFCGSFTNDYNSMITKDLESYPKYSVTGTGNAILSNRISYFYNLHGTSLTIDTACSSSLVCFHLANQSLLDGESDISIVVGSSLHFDPNIFITMTDLGMLSTDGRCRAFDAGGSGYVRGEGICAVILKRQSVARDNGDAIRAIVRATGSNHDGRKQGITLPNSVAQEELIRSTYRTHKLNPDDTQYFEAHGTGTAAGDPIETRAVGAVFSGREKPLYIGSVKTNIGHLEGASGLAGLIKTVMALEKGQIPPNMHLKNPNPKIDFKNWKLEVPTSLLEWKRPEGGVRRASINSFGYGGTNAHVVIEEYVNNVSIPKAITNGVVANGVHDRPFLLPFTSHSAKAGELFEEKLAEYVKSGEITLADLAYTLAVRRSLHQHRSFVVANNNAKLLEQLQVPRPSAPWSPAESEKPRLGFVFTGQGAQWHAMGRQLIQESPLFRQTLERCDAVLQALPDSPSWNIIEELSKSKEDSLLGQTMYSQTICTALQLALVDLMKTWGITPSGVVGHSSGEMGAAYAAGILSFENAMVAAYYRGLYMSAPNEGGVPGAMMAVGMTELKAIDELKPYKGRITIAAVNSPGTITVSGDEDAIVELRDNLNERKVFARQLQVKQAFHSHHMYPLAPAYENALKSRKEFVTQQPTCRMFSSVTARLADPAGMQAKYWATNMTNVVRFSDALTGILLDEYDNKNIDVLVEIGPHPALKGPSRQIAQSLKLDIPYISSLTRGVPDFEGLLTMAGQLFSLGYPVDLAAANKNISLSQSGEVIKSETGNKLSNFPTYTWDHKRYWSETRVIKEHRQRRFRHSVLGHIQPGSVERYPRWRNYLRLSEIPWLLEHVVDGKVLFPGAGYMSMAVEAAVRLQEGEISAIALREISIKAPLVIPDDEGGIEVILELRPVTTSAKSKSDTWYEFTIFSFDNTGFCQEHCSGGVSVSTGAPASLESLVYKTNIDDLRKSTNRSVPVKTFYRHLASIGLEYGENFRLLDDTIESGNGFSLSPLRFNPKALPSEAADATIVHPSLLDASFHVVFNAIESILGRPLDEPLVPTFIRSLRFSGLFSAIKSQDEQRYQICSMTKLPSPRVAISDLFLQGAAGNLMMEIQGLEVTSLGREMPEGYGNRALFYRQKWLPAFDLLSDDKALDQRSLSEVAEIFAHQYPNSKILHLASSADKTKEIALRLGASKGQRRKFQRLDVHVAGASEEALAELNQLAEDSNGLVKVVEPQNETYDLVIVSADGAADFKSFVAEKGSVIFEGAKAPIAIADYRKLFSGSQLTAYRKGAQEKTTYSDELTVVLPAAPSQRVQAIFEAVKKVYTAPIKTTTLKAVAGDYDLSTPGSMLVLATIDEQVTDDAVFTYVQKLLLNAKKDLVWLLEGATYECARPEQAMVLGLIRTARSENDQLKVDTVDVGENSPAETVAATIDRVFAAGLDEDETTERDGLVYLPKIEADDSRNRKLHNGPSQEPVLEPFGEKRPLALTIGKVGLLETLHFIEDEEIVDTALAADEIEIEVKASAINFRDIAVSMGIIDDYKLGDECSGFVTQVGSSVDNFKVGDRVVAWRPGQGAHRALVRNPASLCYKLQGDMPFADAAALPLILTTAYYALIDTARIQAGETILIHSAAGGVGQMAVQIAQRAGARVLVTVGSPAKREVMRRVYGIPEEDMFSSRDDSFVKGVMKATDNKGVDVVLNSLAGPLLHATWSVVNAFGRFIEIGKRDIHESTRITMEPFRKNVMFASVDLITMFEKNKRLGARVFKECCDLVHNGEIKPPAEIATVSYADAVKGFRLLQMGKHVGKVVLVPSKDDIVPVLPGRFRNTGLFDESKTYLLVGGLGGLGRVLSQWMIRKGARKLAFLSRSGADKPEAKATVDWLQERGIKVDVYSGDVSKLADVQACVNGIGSSLAGIFHAAMVLQDTPLETMTVKNWQRSIQPKVNGATNLHQATLGQPLDFFVCFSSVAAILGSKAQANYSAGNSFLDALMRNRREQGLAGTTMNVGAVSNIGVIADSLDLQKAMERLGMDLINEQELLYQLEEAVKSTSSPKTFNGLDEHQIITGVGLIRPDVYWSSKPLLRNLYINHDFGSRGEDTNKKSLLATLGEESDPEQKDAILLEAFIDKIAKVLATPRDSILANNTLSSYGLDSIVAVEFRKWFRKEIQVDIALFDILSSQSIRALVSKAAKLIPAATAAAPQAADKPAQEAAEKKTTEGEAEVTEVKKNEITKVTNADVVPLSTYQSRLWFLHSFLEDKSNLNLPVVMRITGTPDRDALRRTILELSMRNGALRTAYFEGDDFTQQKPVEDFDLDVSLRDFSTAADPEESLKQYLAHYRQIELDIENGEVATWSLVKLGEEQYVFICMMHHISVDRGCFKLLMNQIVMIYDALRADKDLATIPKPELSYIDFTLWHNAYLQSEEMEVHKAWWKSTLAGIPDASKTLPFAKGERPAQGDPSRADLKTNLDAKLFARMKRLATQVGGTPYHFILAAFRAFLYRYTQDSDLVMLVIDGNRPHPDAEDIAGFFVNMCPVRCQDECDESFDELLRKTKERALEAMSHNAIPFDAIVDLMQVKKTPAYSPIGQVVVNYQIHGPAPQYKTSDFTVESITMDDIPSSCDLSLEALETAEHSLDIRIEYATALYSKEDMERFIDNFLTFLSSSIKDRHQPIQEIEISGPLELQRLEKGYWNTGFVEPLWKDQSVVDRIMANSRSQPQATAIVTSDGNSISYGQLAQNSLSIASALQAAGVKGGDKVALLAQPGVEAVTGMLGTLLTCNGYVALDTDFAHDRLSFMITDSGSKVLLAGPGTDSLAKELVSKSSITVISIEDAIKKSEKPQAFNPRKSDDPFYMIYTSGSTGTPKGVVLKESNTYQMLATLHKDYAFTNQDRFLHQSSMSFDLSIVQIFSGLTAGGRVCIAALDARKDPTALAEFMRKEQVTVTYFTPTQYALLIESNSEALKKCSTYRVAYFAGERLPVRVAKAFYDLGTPATLYNTWSPSEVVVQTTIAKIDYPEENAVSLPIGYPMDNCRHYILDNQCNPLPLGFIGELVVGGAQVGAGYLNRPEENAKSFVEDPWASEEDRKRGWTRMFRTGDRGAFRPDGQLEFHGRIAGDKQIKLRGFRVDLGEVEQRIYQTSKTIRGGLVDISVVARPREGDPDDLQLVAFLVPAKNLDKKEQSAFVTEVHAAIAPHLNHYMLPNGYQFLEKLPVTIGGKVDRRNLLSRDLDLVQPSSEEESAAPASDVSEFEKSVLELFQGTVGAKRYTQLTDNFFEKGGTSILLVRLQAKLRRKFKVAPTLADLIKEPTAASVSKFIESSLGKSANGGAGSSASTIDWAAEIKLPTGGGFIPGFGTPRVSRSDVSAILVAGSESLVGGHLLAKLLETKPNAKFYVVGSSKIIDIETIVDTFAKYNLLNDRMSESDVREKITSIQGTLSQPGFGLSKAGFRQLGQAVQSIYYCGGDVSLLKTYSFLKTSNVSPIFDLIRLAGTGDYLSEIHYLSTWSTAHLQSWKSTKRTKKEVTITEEELTHFTPPAEDEFGYFKTRWVAENLLFQAASRGFPVTITRAPAIATSLSAHYAGANASLDEFTIHMVLSMVETGVVPQVDSASMPPFAVDVVPVDYLVSALAALTSDSTSEPESGKAQIFHLSNPQPLKLKDLPGMIPQIRPDVKEASIITLEEWLKRMEGAKGVEDAAAATVRSSVLKEYFERGHVMFSLDRSQTKQILDKVAPELEATCPAIDVEFLTTMWKMI